MLRIEALLLQPMLKSPRDSTSIIWKKNVDPQKLKSVLRTILAEVNQEQSSKVASILPTKPSLPISPNSKSKESFCPTMKHYGLSLTDRHLHEALLRDLMSLNKKHEKGYQKHLLSYDGVTRGFFNLVSIPKATFLPGPPTVKHGIWLLVRMVIPFQRLMYMALRQYNLCAT
mmetsp:Transcript_17866/g.25185  ORF Transcript_17866/g.25185 Transcript_17866/m.25185 type:complete len:172 (-) Transcript_17866:520-1035(-)